MRQFVLLSWLTLIFLTCIGIRRACLRQASAALRDVLTNRSTRWSWKASRLVAVRRRTGWDVESWVAVEEPDGFESEADVVDRHDRPVLRPRGVRRPERVPQDDIGVDQVAILFGPHREPHRARVQIRIVAGRVQLVGGKSRHPHRVAGKASTAADTGPLVGQQEWTLVRNKLVPDRLPEPVAHLPVDYPPVTRLERVVLPATGQFSLDQR